MKLEAGLRESINLKQVEECRCEC